MASPTAVPGPVSVFISYSRRDTDVRTELEKELRCLQDQGLITTWTDRQIRPGERWADEIHTALKSAKLIMLLISRHFRASDYCNGIEFRQALEQQASGASRIIPILASSTNWEKSPFAKFQVLPENGKPINKWRPRDDAYTSIGKGLIKILTEVNGRPATTNSTGKRELHFDGKVAAEVPGLIAARQRAFDADASRYGVMSSELIVEREVTAEGHASTIYSIRDLRLTTEPELIAYRFRCKSATGMLAGPESGLSPWRETAEF